MLAEVLLVGNLGGDPEMRYLPDGTAVTNFSLATNKKWKDKSSGEPVEQVTWWRVSVWGKQAENANEYLSKGRQVLVKGEMKVDPATGGPKIWTDKEGNPRASFEVTSFKVQYLAGGREGGGEGGNGAGQHYPQEEDEIPF